MHRVISNDLLVQAQRHIVLPALLGGPSLPVEHLGEPCRAWKALCKALPECASSLVGTLAVLHPPGLPQAGLGLFMRGEILRQALVEVKRSGQFLPLFLEASQSPERFGRPGYSRGLCQAHLVHLDAVGRLVLALIDGPEQVIRFSEMRPLGVEPQHVLQDHPPFRQAPTTTSTAPRFMRILMTVSRGEQIVKGAQASLDFLPELSLCQTINTGEKLLRIWRSLRLWQAGKEFTAMTQGHRGLLITGCVSPRRRQL